MSNEPSQGGTTPPTRRDRREAARQDRRLAAARTAAPKPAWQSPMVLMSVAAVAVGLVVILLASGVLGGRSNGGTGDLLVPIRPTPTGLADPANPRTLGSADAPITIEVWSDFQCPACGFFARQVEPDLIDEYVKDGTVRLVYRDLATTCSRTRTARTRAPSIAGSSTRSRRQSASTWPGSVPAWTATRRSGPWPPRRPRGTRPA
jgi:hypothetical protein